MNKYQEAYENVKRACTVPFLGRKPIDICGLSLDSLKKLVDKETPKKPNVDYVIDDTYCFCPVCGNIIIEKRMLNTVNSDLFKKSNSFCSECGQKIDWSEEE